MAIVTGTFTVNAAFLREIKDENQHLQQLLSTLRRLTGIPIVVRNHRNRIRQLLEQLSDQLALHFALEEAYGYFEEAIDVAPRVSQRAEELRSEHASLYESISKISEAAQQWCARQLTHDDESEDTIYHGLSDARSFYRIVMQFHQFDEQLMQHEQAEHSLILEALERDIGGEG
jgi:hypothetical protein